MPLHLRQVLKYAFREQRALLRAFFFFLLGAGLLFVFTGTAWWAWPDAVLGLATLGVGGIIWLGEMHEDWIESLPKKLTVVFAVQENEDRGLRAVLICERAYLAGESDIRAWGQQIGGQMSGDRQLNFRPDIQQRDCGVESAAGGERFKHYQVLFVLNSMPDWGGTEKKNNDELRARAETVKAAVAAPSSPKCVCWRECGRYEPFKPLEPAPRVSVKNDRICLEPPL